MPLLLLAITILSVQQGDAVVIRFPANPAITKAVFDGQSVPFFPYRESYRAVFGIPADKKPGQYLFVADFQDDQKIEQEIRVRKRKFPLVIQPLPPTVKLTAQEVTQNIQKEKKKIESLLTITPEIFFNKLFGLPLRDNRQITGSFGEIRKMGDQQIRHLGMDFYAPLGTPVAAINNGRIKKSYFDPVYGNSIFIDHGGGIFSLYLHLDKILIKEGDRVNKGQVIGRVGQTGLATAPHLHLSIKIGSVAVDPVRFVSAFSD